MAKAKPSAAMIRLGHAIRRYRQAQDRTQQAVATAVGYTDGWLSLVETARLLPERAIIERLEQELAITAGALTDLYDVATDAAVPEWFRPWKEAEEDASVLHNVELLVIPGLLQTEAYASCLLADPTEVQARMQRQQVLRKDNAPKLRCVIDELALHREVGGPEVMREQLEALVNAVSPNVTVQVVPAKNNPFCDAAFVLATLSSGKVVAYVQAAPAGTVTDNPRVVADLEGIWESVRDQALSQQDSISLIKRVMEERWT